MVYGPGVLNLERDLFFLMVVTSAVASSVVRGLLLFCKRRDIDPDMVRMRMSCLAEGML